MTKKSIYNCILYETGDKVQEKHGSTEILEIEATTLKYVGIFPTLFLKFKGKPADVGQFSNLFIPAAETIEKYKDGLKYFDEVKVKKQITNMKETRTKITFKRNSNILTEEDLKPVIVKRGTFTEPAHKKEM